jgi:starch phosphorylase
LFGGKAAPGYAYAKLVIKFINSVAGLVNGDPRTKGTLTVLFMENYNVSLAQRIFPASDISEQISTASKEASGTGNMKFMMNGAVTVGTMDGANIEIAEAVGDENIFTFGMSVSEVLAHYRARDYRSVNEYNSNYKLRRIVDTLTGGFYKDAKYDEFKPIFDSLTAVNDEYFVLADWSSYVETMQRAMCTYGGAPEKWLSMSAANISMSGRFSSDETIRQYAGEIWGIRENKVRE